MEDQEEYTFDTYMVATVAVKAGSFEEARAALRYIDVSFDEPVRLRDAVMTSIGFRGAAAAWPNPDMPVEQGRHIESHYNDTGFAQLERMVVVAPELPMLFRVVQVSPEGEDMKTVTADQLDNLMQFDDVIRVGLGREVSAASEIEAPEVLVGDNDTVEVSDGWEALSGFSDQPGYNGPLVNSSVPIKGRMTEHILSHPGLYCAVFDPGSLAYLVLHRNDNETVWKELG
ncbi:hypothetical protein [Nocardia nova]|nr:hypothetical protein [Nocardia nova]